MKVKDNISKLNIALSTLSLAKRQGECVKAINTDLEQIENLYAKFVPFAKERNFTLDRQSTANEQFVLACVMAFTPNALFGGKLNKKFRTQMAKTIKKSQSVIYFILYKTINFYNLYPQWRYEVEETYKMIYNELMQKNGN